MPEPVRQIAIRKPEERPLPPQWREFIRFCAQLNHGEIERLAIQNGVPVIAETVKKKVRFTPVP